MPTERPILFRDRLVRANLADLKTETRRCGPAAVRWLKAEAGDILWVREAWAKIEMETRITAHNLGMTTGPMRGSTLFRATAMSPFCDTVKWKPSIHMPRTAARLFLELVEKPWVEPLQAITEQGAIAEGLQATAGGYLGAPSLYADMEPATHGTARGAFSSLWDSINGPLGRGWDTNPSVIVLRYRRVKP